MASDSSPPQPRGDAIGQLHKPGNFLWLYITVTVVCTTSIAVKLITVILKKRRDKKRDPDLERQQLEPFQRWWYPRRYDKNGNRIKSVTDSGTSSGTASPVIMTGALSPNSLPSPIQLSSFDNRPNGAGVSSTASLVSLPTQEPSAPASAGLISDSDSNSSRSRLPAVNPFTSRPFRSAIPRATDSSDSSTRTPTTRSESNAVESGYGGLSQGSENDSKITSDKFNQGQFGRSLTHNARPLDPAPKSGVEGGAFAHGYGSSTDTTRSSRDDRRSNRRSRIPGPSPEKQQTKRASPSRDSPSKPTKASDSSSGTPSRMPSSSRQAASFSRTPSSSSARTPDPSPARRLGSGKFRNVVREDKWSRELREKEAEAKKKAEQEEAEKAELKRKKQAEKEGKKKGKDAK